jgi:hypothetical protein
MKKLAALLAIPLLLAACSGTTLHFGPYVTAVTPTSATILWVTPQNAAPSKVVVESGAMTSITTEKIPDQKETLHVAKVTGLEPGKPYNYMLLFKPPFNTVTSRAGTFRAAPDEAHANDPIRFAVYGDTRTYPDRHRWVANAMYADGPLDFVVQSGDLVANGAKWNLWKKYYFDPGQELFRHTAMYPALGNHEMDGVLCQQLFDLPRSYYSFDFGNVHVVCLNSEIKPPKVDRDMCDWLARDLAASKAEWKIVSYHRPTFDTVYHRTTWGQEDLLPIFERGGVDIVMSGHTHNYQRFRPIVSAPGRKPILFFVSAGGGAPTYPINPSPILEKAYAGLHYCLFDVAGNKLQITAKYPNGKILDHVSLVKENGNYQKEITDREITVKYAREAAFLESGFFAHSPRPPEPGQPLPLLISRLSFPEGAQVEVASAAPVTPRPGELPTGTWTIRPTTLTGFKAHAGLDEDHNPDDLTYDPVVVLAYPPPDLHFTARGQPDPPVRVSLKVTFQGKTFTTLNTGVYFRTFTIRSWKAQRAAMENFDK